MTIIAVAFHETLAHAKMREFFAKAMVAGAEAGVTSCPACAQGFALIFLKPADAKNETYRMTLRQLIGNDCLDGVHQNEYPLDIPDWEQ
jgi:hypothetical protein